jgi:glycosyltransferase involved in cell wall biosynthesis
LVDTRDWYFHPGSDRESGLPMTSTSLTIVTTCKGRLQYLRQTLPTLVAQPAASCVVVDYGCPDHSGDWVQANFPQVTVVRWPDTGNFNLSHARNLGVATATTDVICMIDADVRLAPAFVPTILAQFDARHYYLAEPPTDDISGTVVCARSAFEFVQGYDEACAGWGGEDMDFYDRLDFHGLQQASFPATLLSALPHPDSVRTEYYAIADKDMSNSINRLYSHMKLDLMRLFGKNLSADYRSRINAQVRDAAIASSNAGRPVRIFIPFADGTINHCGIHSSLAYVIDLSKRAGKGISASSAIDPMKTGAGVQL